MVAHKTKHGATKAMRHTRTTPTFRSLLHHCGSQAVATVTAPDPAPDETGYVILVPTSYVEVTRHNKRVTI